MWDRLSLVTAPTADAVTLAEAKDRLRITSADQDTDLARMIAQATAMIDGKDGIGVAVMPQTRMLTLDAFETPIRIPLGPVTAINSITYLDAAGAEQTLAPASYRALLKRDPAAIEPAYGESWPTTQAVRDAVAVTFTAGHAAAPEKIKQAILLLVGLMDRNREAATPTELHELPFGVRDILESYAVGRVA